jgi:hypothetical protein
MFGLGHSKKKIFCISFQRTGTTSVGEFFHQHGFSVARWSDSNRNQWSKSWVEGDDEAIYSSSDFRRCQVFEDDPWWCGDFYKVLFHRFPESRFIHFTRDADKWFNSMCNHSTTPRGRNMGNTYMHAKLFRREEEYWYLLGGETPDLETIDNLLELGEAHREHYKSIYNARNRDVRGFFRRNDASRVFAGELEDEHKWQKLGNFFGIEVPPGFELHANDHTKWQST